MPLEKYCLYQTQAFGSGGDKDFDCDQCGCRSSSHSNLTFTPKGKQLVPFDSWQDELVCQITLFLTKEHVGTAAVLAVEVKMSI